MPLNSNFGELATEPAERSDILIVDDMPEKLLVFETVLEELRAELTAVPGITPEMADAVIAGRPYADMRGVNAKLAGLTDEQRDSVYTRLWKPLDLNSATAEEIELIPGMGARMRHEFEEYRPYRGIEQFRREIGKYVEPAEVARLERYVTIAS